MKRTPIQAALGAVMDEATAVNKHISDLETRKMRYVDGSAPTEEDREKFLVRLNDLRRENRAAYEWLMAQQAHAHEPRNVQGMTRAEFEHHLRTCYLHDNMKLAERGTGPNINGLTEKDERDIAERVELNYPAAKQPVPTKSRWPMLEDLHLWAIVGAYNGGYSKAADGRVFPNPWSLEGSQAAAWDLGTRDGKELHDKLAKKSVKVVGLAEPIPMILHCPACHAQHIDVAKPCNMGVGCEEAGSCYAASQDKPEECTAWNNPPHRSHLCAHCGTVWRPADVATTGVKEIATKGSSDAAVKPHKRELTDVELRGMWRAAGGSFHGPLVETGTMPVSQLLPLLRDMLSGDRP